MIEIKNITPGAVCEHHSGRIYTITKLTNLKSTNQEKFPITVVYIGCNGNEWSRPRHEFAKSFKIIHQSK